MRSQLRAVGILAVALSAIPASTRAQQVDDPRLPDPARPTPAPAVVTAPAPAPRANPMGSARVIGTHQINRYAAIRSLQESLKANPRSLPDWIILGELAHEVAADAPPDQAATYYRLSREAYEKALALAPNKPGLKAAVQFARDSEEGAEEFQQIRDRASRTYLNARRRDLAANDYVPAVRVWTPPTAMRAIPSAVTPGASVVPQPARTGAPSSGEGTLAPSSPSPIVGGRSTVAIAPDTSPAISPAPTNSASTDVANFGTRQIYTSPYTTYQPLYIPQGSPYTYRQYNSSYYPADFGVDSDAGPLPTTLQRYQEQTALDAGRRPVDPAYTSPRP